MARTRWCLCALQTVLLGWCVLRGHLPPFATIWMLNTAHMFTIILYLVAGHRAFGRGGRPRVGTAVLSRPACPRCGALRRTRKRGDRMDDERPEGRADAPAPAIPH